MNEKIKGAVYGCIAAVSYGMNPLCALNLYNDGFNVCSVLTYRFVFGTLILALLMLVRRYSFVLTRREALVLAGLGVLFAVSSITYFISFKYMGAGIAATLVFAYPVMVAVIMAIFFHERLSRAAIFSILMTVGGIALLYRGDNGRPIAPLGFLYIMVSALAYALYIVVVNRSHIVMSSVKLTFYAMLVCLLCLIAFSYATGEPLQGLATPSQWFYATFLGLVPTVISLVFMAMAIRCIGSTPTAIMGALEPVTAVIIGYFMFNEAITPRITAGILLILFAVLLIIIGGQLPSVSRVRHILRRGRPVTKLWRWRT